MLTLKRTLDLTPRVASIPTPSLTYVPLGQFGQDERKVPGGGARHRALASSDGSVAASGSDATAVKPLSQCASDELWLWRFLLAGRPFGATGTAVGGPDDGTIWLSATEQALARRLPRTQMRHRFLSERIAMRWIFGRWFHCSPAHAPVPAATPGVSSMECDGPHGKVRVDMAHAGLWLFVALGQGPLALAAHVPALGSADEPPSPEVLSDNPLAPSRDAAHRLCLARLAGQGDAPEPHADVPLISHPYVSVPYAGRTRYLYDMSVSSRLTVVAARDSIVHRVRAFGWQN
ncbi:hypothetical protein [Pandoraea pulmonicola]|uniref:Uncharacterized protein n=1 Tax=Pandoraea pulmonicola TaxID=93221 RepID=A0AAJ5D2N0_PANPU|nr:hypothetical protein [Pandoraea pulmonicola]AJC22809.1 hypothetical protein RO07_24355 [Pandoraea pulmonicola]SUA92899.1 Uncharacterised protein [Pandoraea pulmonicola]